MIKLTSSKSYNAVWIKVDFLKKLRDDIEYNTHENPKPAEITAYL